MLIFRNQSNLNTSHSFKVQRELLQQREDGGGSFAELLEVRNQVPKATVSGNLIPCDIHIYI